MENQEPESWPHSQSELEAAQKLLFEKISFVDLLEKYSKKIEGCQHAEFTHKCSCPFHGRGSERTPSFYFSERTKNYHCFSCAAHGNFFDMLSRFEGRPAHLLVADMLQSHSISDLSIDNLELAGQDQVRKAYDAVFQANLEMSIAFREYLIGLKDTRHYAAETAWVDNMLSRIDERFASSEELTRDQAKSFKIQMLMDLARRKGKIKRESL